jgi:CDP-diacylglycerol--glycerol-3-phosphate 3-phosphatidyltransferase
MLNIFARASVSRVTDPVGAWLARSGLSPNVMTVIGTAGAVIGSLWLFPTGHLLAGGFVVLGFTMFDLLDGAIARATGGGTRFGTVLDATCDRIADGALMAGLAWYCFVVTENLPLAGATLMCLVLAQVTSYIKARAEATGLTANVGVVERAERLIITLGGAGLAGFGVPYGLDVAIWLLVVLSLVTVAQRIVAVWRSAQAGQEMTGAEP